MEKCPLLLEFSPILSSSLKVEVESIGGNEDVLESPNIIVITKCLILLLLTFRKINVLSRSSF